MKQNISEGIKDFKCSLFLLLLVVSHCSPIRIPTSEGLEEIVEYWWFSQLVLVFDFLID